MTDLSAAAGARSQINAGATTSENRYDNVDLSEAQELGGDLGGTFLGFSAAFREAEPGQRFHQAVKTRIVPDFLKRAL